jgi:hypothetical protein
MDRKVRENRAKGCQARRQGLYGRNPAILNGLSETNCARDHLELLLGEGSYYTSRENQLQLCFRSPAEPNFLS